MTTMTWPCRTAIPARLGRAGAARSMDAPESEVAAERAMRAATAGAGARISACSEAADGTWGGLAWNSGFTSNGCTRSGSRGNWASTRPARRRSRATGVRGAGGDVARSGRGGVRRQTPTSGGGDRAVHHHGQVAAAAAYFGQDVHALIQRLLSEQLADGGWNCEAEFGSTRSSFNTTICALEALLVYERAFGSNPAVEAASVARAEYLLERRPSRSCPSFTGEVITRSQTGTDWTQRARAWWHYDVLRGLITCVIAASHLERLDEAITLVRTKQQPDGRWLLDAEHPGTMLVTLDAGVGQPSRWNTLRALRVLRWVEGG